MFPSFQQMIEVLGKVSPPAVSVVSKRAAVAIVLRDGSSGPEMLMIQRAVKEGDPWSGHMGFPGGRKDPGDASDLCCAKRETWEEVGLDLDAYGDLICQLSDVNTGWRADRPEMLVAPFVFVINDHPELALNHEVDDTVWIPIHFLMDDVNRARHQWEWRGETLESDAFTFDQRLIWGLSLMMIDELLDLVGRRQNRATHVTRA